MADICLSPDSRSFIDRVLRRPSVASTASTVSTTTASSRTLRERFWSTSASNNFSTSSVSITPSTHAASIKSSGPYVPQHAFRDSCALPPSQPTPLYPAASASAVSLPASPSDSPAPLDQPQLRYIFSHDTTFVPRAAPLPSLPSPTASSPSVHSRASVDCPLDDKAPIVDVMRKSSSLALQLSQKRAPAVRLRTRVVPTMAPVPAPAPPPAPKAAVLQTPKQRPAPGKPKKGLGQALAHYIKPGGQERSGRQSVQRRVPTTRRTTVI